MKIITNLLAYLLLIVVVGGLLVFGFPALKNKLFYSSKLVPKEVFALNDQINSSSPEDVTQNRVYLLKQMDDFAKGSVSGNGFSSEIYFLIKARLDQALKEIPITKVPKGKVKIWYIYNMGIIAKSEDKTIAFDLAGTYVYSNLADFTKYIDILVVTHPHNDHFDLDVVKEALKNGVTVIIPGDKVLFTNNQIIRNSNGEDLVSLIKKRQRINSDNFISLKPQEKTIVKGVEITAYPANHRQGAISEINNGGALLPINWYLVKLSGLTLLHTGDADRFDYQTSFASKNVDVFMTDNVDPRTNEGLINLVPNAKTILPLHVLELNHGPDIVNSNSMDYRNILDDYSNGYFKPSNRKIRFIPMIWGESLFF